MEVFQSIINDKPKFPSNFSRTAAHLISGLLRKDPAKRYGAEKVRKHKFFSRTQFNLVLEKSLEPPFFPTVKSDGDTSNFKTFKT